METSKTDLVRLGFAKLLKEASCASTLPCFAYAHLERHPFQLNLPQRYGDIAFIGKPNTSESFDCMIRLLGREFARGHESAENKAINFLRIITAPCDHDWEHRQDKYYEIGIRGSVYITGGCTYYMGSGLNTPLEKVMSCLSSIYQISVYRNTLSKDEYFRDHKKLWADLNREWEEARSYQRKWFAEVAKYRNFKPGDRVTFNPDMDEKPRWCKIKHWKGASFIIEKVETIPVRCNCGVGDETPIFLHHFLVCNLSLIHESVHNQNVKVKGVDGWIGGYEFDRNKITP